MGKILVIDDEKSIRRALKEIFEFENYEVDEAEDGKEGLEKATSQYYDVIFCDIKMPKMDRSEEHTSELQSRPHLVCRLLLEKKKKKKKINIYHRRYIQ